MLHVKLALPEDLAEFHPREPGRVFSGMPADAEVFAVSNSLDGLPFAILGLWEWLPGMALAWGAIDQIATLHEVGELNAALRAFMPTRGLRRIEATVRADFPAGQRWLEVLGFEAEGAMPCYDSDGTTHYRYARTFPENLPK